MRLRFHDPELEAEFRHSFARDALRPTRVTLGFVMLLFMLWGFTDRELFPSYLGMMLTIRAATVIALGLALAATYRPGLYVRWRQGLVAAASLACAGSLTLMSALAPAQIGAQFYTGVGLTVLGTCTLFLLHVPAALAISLVDLFLWVAGSSTLDLPRGSIALSTSFLSSSIILGVLACWIIERFARERFLAHRALDEERDRSERLLLNVLPAPVAVRLKRDPAPIADHHPDASILFADIADFTRLSSTMAPDELVRLLNDVFTVFDQVAARHGVEKIKTIGDAYMAVAGVPAMRPDHLEAIVETALEMREAIMRRGGIPLEVRIGIDTGPVVAGVIGESKFIYDLWGDPVTTASRMESHGVTGAIQVTAAVAERLRDRYALRPRGEIEVKGKGRMAVWLLEGRLAAEDAVPSLQAGPSAPRPRPH